MNKAEELLQKSIKLLPGHLSRHKSIWEEQLLEIPALLQILTYQSEEFIHSESVRGLNTDIEYFEELHDKLCIVLAHEINDTLEKLMDKINLLKKVNNDMKNRIDSLEKASSESYANLSLKVIDGNERQPSLSFLLQCCLRYRTFFLGNLERIVTTLNNIDMKRRETVKELKQAFYIDMNDQSVAMLISLMQYMN